MDRVMHVLDPDGACPVCRLWCEEYASPEALPDRRLCRRCCEVVWHREAIHSTVTVVTSTELQLGAGLVPA